MTATCSFKRYLCRTWSQVDGLVSLESWHSDRRLVSLLIGDWVAAHWRGVDSVSVIVDGCLQFSWRLLQRACSDRELAIVLLQEFLSIFIVSLDNFFDCFKIEAFPNWCRWIRWLLYGLGLLFWLFNRLWLRLWLFLFLVFFFEHFSLQNLQFTEWTL